MTERVTQPAVVQHLEQHVEHVGVRLLDLVEEHDRVRTAADLLGQEATLFVAHVAGRRAEQPRHRELLHVLRHVDANQGVLVTEQVLGQSAGKLGFSDTGRAEEDERADRPLRILEPGPGAPNGAGDSGDRVVLADDTAVERLFHAGQLLRLLLLELGERDASPA